MEDVERAYVHVDYARRSLEEHKVCLGERVTATARGARVQSHPGLQCIHFDVGSGCMLTLAAYHCPIANMFVLNGRCRLSAT